MFMHLIAYFLDVSGFNGLHILDVNGFKRLLILDVNEFTALVSGDDYTMELMVLFVLFVCGVQKLMGENLKVVCAEFSTLS